MLRRVLVELVYDKLLSPSPYVDKPLPGLAESATQIDPSTWVVKLRDGVTWHDGKPFTADDVVFTYVSFRDGSPDHYTHRVNDVPRIDQIVAASQPVNWMLAETTRLARGGLVLKAPEHSLFRYLTLADCTWHQHGVFWPDEGVEPPVTLEDGGVILYIDRVSTRGTLLVTCLDPIAHFGSYFMPATECFLDGFLPWVRAELLGDRIAATPGMTSAMLPSGCQHQTRDRPMTVVDRSAARASEQAEPSEDAGQAARVEHGIEHYDVLIVGAGISGVGASYHLRKQCPGTTFVVLDAQESFGGTWISHRFPGIRSDSDLFTFGYSFKPWTGAPIATAAEILKYMHEVIEENDLAQYIRYRHRISRASWSSAENRWTVEATRTDTGEALRFTANFLWMCQGYYRHSEGYTPDWPGLHDFKGRIAHPETWPDDLDYTGKRVVIIGSGATAATMLPAMARDCEHITMLQRSPTYFRIGRNALPIVDELRRLQVDPAWIHEIIRRKIIVEGAAFSQRCVDEPEAVKQELLGAIREYVGADYDVEKHFTPRYRPWQQRLAFVPDGDMFRAIAEGKASVVTDEIERFTEEGILLKSGDTLTADIIVTATGFNLSMMGDIAFTIDGEPLNFADTVTYRGMMFTGVPNLAWIFGYFRASWTLRVDLVADFVCRLLNHMKAKGTQRVTPTLRPEDRDMPILPWIDETDFNPGYVKRGMHLLPKRGAKREWAHTQDYWREKDEFPAIDLDDAAFVYGPS